MSWKTNTFVVGCAVCTCIFMAMTPIYFLFFLFWEIVFHRFSSDGSAQSDIHFTTQKPCALVFCLVSTLTALLFSRRLIPFIYIRLAF